MPPPLDGVLSDIGPTPDPTPPAPLAPADPSARFRLRELFLWLPLGALLWFPAVGLALGWRALDMRQHGLLLFSLWFYLTTFAWMLFTIRREGLSLGSLLGPLPRGGQWVDGIVAPLLHLGLSGALMLAFFSWLARFSPHLLERFTNANKGFDLGRSNFASSWLVIAVIAPLVEEIFFRGILLHRAARRWGLRRGLVFTSLLFGVLHVNPVGIFAFGMLLGVIFLHTRSLWATTFAHLVNNTLPLLLVMAPSRSSAHAPAEAFPTELFARALPSTTALALAMAVSIALVLRLRWPRADAPMPWAPRAG